MATMLLSAVGDAIGYKNSDWEFNKSGLIIHKQFNEMTENQGMKNFKLDLSWKYSDDTVMSIATAKALLSKSASKSPSFDLNSFGQALALEYKKCNFTHRCPGKTTIKSLSILDKDCGNWNKIPFRE